MKQMPTNWPQYSTISTSGDDIASRERVMIERASIAGGVAMAVSLVALISLIFYIHMRRRSRRKCSDYYPEMETPRSHQHLVVRLHTALLNPDSRPIRSEQKPPPHPQRPSPEAVTVSQLPYVEYFP